MLNLPNIACLNQGNVIVGLVAFDYGRQVLQACRENGVIKREGCLAPFTILCMSKAICRAGQAWRSKGTGASALMYHGMENMY